MAVSMFPESGTTTPLRHASAGLVAAMQNAPWAAPDLSRPACMKWSQHDVTLLPWIATLVGQSMLFLETSGPRKGQTRSAVIRRAHRGSGYSDAEVDLVLREVAPEIGDFKVLESRDVHHYADPKPGLEALNCERCCRLILAAQGIRADILATRAADARQAAAYAEMDRERTEAALLRGDCPKCGVRLLGDHPAFESFAATLECAGCGFTVKRVGTGHWNFKPTKTKRGTTDAHT
jgi:ribosomal protein S27AE